METRFHSVRLDKERCRGCSNCLMHCPTEAIRVRGGRAHIIDELCIDCGACIRVCSYHAKVAMTDHLEDIQAFPYRIALPAPRYCAHFTPHAHSIRQIMSALKQIGFHEVFEVARGADIVTRAIRELLKDHTLPRPLISSACPTVTRIIKVRFPGLIEHLVPLRQPMEVAAGIARRAFCEKYHVQPEEIGIFFITPCAAKMTAIRSPLGQRKSHVDGAISITEAYGAVMPLLNDLRHSKTPSTATPLGVGWGSAGGEAAATRHENTLAVDGIENVIRVLEEVELGKLSDLDFLETAACVGGCVGGPLVYDNNFVARNTLKSITRAMPQQDPQETVDLGCFNQSSLLMEQPIMPNDTQLKLSEDMEEALDKMKLMDEILERLPGYDCGSCGSPSCRTFAEDIVRGYCVEMDCIFLLKDRLKLMAQQMVDLSQTQRELMGKEAANAKTARETGAENAE